MSVVVVVLVLAGGAVAADVVARDRVEARLAQEVTAGFGLESPPDVEIAGTAFLPQVIGGSVERVDVAAPRATIGELPMEDVELTLLEVAPREPYVAQTFEFVGLVPLASAQELTPEGLELRIEDGAVVVVAQVLGLELEARATPVADGRAVVAQIESLSLGGVSVEVADLPAPVAGAIEEVRIPFDGLPEGVELTEVVVATEGFRVRAAGQDVALLP